MWASAGCLEEGRHKFRLLSEVYATESRQTAPAVRVHVEQCEFLVQRPLHPHTDGQSVLLGSDSRLCMVTLFVSRSIPPGKNPQLPVGCGATWTNECDAAL